MLSETTGVEDQRWRASASRCSHSRSKQQHLLGTTKRDYFETQQVAKELAEARSILQSQPPQRAQITHGPNRVYEDLQLTLQRQEPLLVSLRAKADILRQQITEARAQLREFNERSVCIVRLQRAVEIEGAVYRKYMAQAEQGRIDQALEVERITSLTVAEPPRTTRRRSSRGRSSCWASVSSWRFSAASPCRCWRSTWTARWTRRRDRSRRWLTPIVAVIPRLRSRDLRVI